MKWVKNEMPMKIGDIVSIRTGMSREDLLSDTKEYRINNLEEAAKLFIKHVVAKDKIGCFCDYDTDGISCGSSMNTLSKVLGYPVEVYVPHRFTDGYGIKPRQVEMFADCKLLILCDNGIAANEAVNVAIEKGMDVLILDHHEARVNENQNVMLPNATVIVDPHITGGDFEDYCGAGLVYSFAKEVLRRCNYLSADAKQNALDKITIFAAIGTVGDVVSLTGENRRIVRQGIDLMMKGKGTTGLRSLLQAMHLDTYITAIDIAFFISPAFNASGRLDDYGSSFVCSTVSYDEKDTSVVQDDVKEIIEHNQERKKISMKRFAAMEALIQAKHLENEKFFILVDEEGSLGINGLVAGKLTEKFKKPCIVMSPLADPNLIKGSGRAPEWVNLKSILDQNNALIEAYGGHPAACGITMRRNNIESFTDCVNLITPDIPDNIDFDQLFYDLQCRPVDAPNVLKAINTFAPYGAGNPQLIVRIDNIGLDMSRSGKYEFFMGDHWQHLKLFSKYFNLLWFDGTKEYQSLGSPRQVSAVGTLGLNVWNGNATVIFQVIDLIPA